VGQVKIVNSKKPPTRSGHSVVCWNYVNMVIFAGSGRGAYLNDLWNYSFALCVWKELRVIGDIPKARRAHSTCLVMDNMMYVCGGCCWERSIGYIQFCDIYKIDLRKLTWRKINIMGDGIPTMEYQFMGVIDCQNVSKLIIVSNINDGCDIYSIAILEKELISKFRSSLLNQNFYFDVSFILGGFRENNSKNLYKIYSSNV